MSTARAHLEVSEFDDDSDVLTAEEVAKLLRMNKKTVYELFRAGQLPGAHLGREFRFSRRAIMAKLGDPTHAEEAK